MWVHRNKCGYRGKTFEHYHGNRCICFEGAPVPVILDTEIDWRRHINVYWTSVRDGAVYGGNSTTAPEKPAMVAFARREKHFRLWLTNNAARARELGRKLYEREGLVGVLGPAGFPLVSVARGGVRFPTPADYARAQGQARQAEVADEILGTNRHREFCKYSGEPFTEISKDDDLCACDPVGKFTRKIQRALSPRLPAGSYIVDPETGATESVLDETRASLVASGGWCAPAEAAYGLGLTPIRPKVNPDDFVWRKTRAGQLGVLGKVHVAVVNDRMEVALCTTTGVDGTNIAILGNMTEEQVEHEGRCKRCLHYINATGGALPPGWPKTVNVTAVKKEFGMDTKARAEALRNEADKLLERAAELENRPSEPEVDDEGNAIVWIRATFRGNDERSYDYAAIRTTDGLWYSTGGERSGTAASWDRLVGYFFDNCAKVEVWQATEFTGIGAK